MQECMLNHKRLFVLLLLLFAFEQNSIQYFIYHTSHDPGYSKLTPFIPLFITKFDSELYNKIHSMALTYVCNSN